MADAIANEGTELPRRVSVWPGRVVAIAVGLGLGLFLVGGFFFFGVSRLGRGAPARIAATNLTARTVVSCIKQVYGERSTYPKSLTELVPNYLERVPLDGWRRPFVYHVESDGSITLMSLGDDGLIGGNGAAADLWWRIGGSSSSEGVGAPPSN